MNRFIAQVEQVFINRVASLNDSLAHAERVGDFVRRDEILSEISNVEEAIRKLRSPG